MDERENAEPPMLHRVIAVAHRFSDGTWIVGMEVWQDRVILTWAKPTTRDSRYIENTDDYAPPETPLYRTDESGASDPDLHLFDDVGTVYPSGSATASGTYSGSRGEIEFVGAPPLNASVLTVRRTIPAEEISVSLVR